MLLKTFGLKSLLGIRTCMVAVVKNSPISFLNSSISVVTFNG